MEFYCPGISKKYFLGDLNGNRRLTRTGVPMSACR
jgi:hypothetical protein